MTWNEKPYWFKSGVITSVIAALISIISLLLVFIKVEVVKNPVFLVLFIIPFSFVNIWFKLFSGLCPARMIASPVEISCGGLLGFLVFALDLTIIVVCYFIIGALIGAIIGKMRKEENKLWPWLVLLLIFIILPNLISMSQDRARPDKFSLLVEPDPKPATAMDPITLSRDTIVMQGDEVEHLNVNIYNPSKNVLLGVQPTIDCDGVERVEYTATKKDIEPGKFTKQEMLISMQNLPSNTYECSVHAAGSEKKLIIIVTE